MNKAAKAPGPAGVKRLKQESKRQERGAPKKQTGRVQLAPSVHSVVRYLRGNEREGVAAA